MNLRFKRLDFSYPSLEECCFKIRKSELCSLSLGLNSTCVIHTHFKPNHIAGLCADNNIDHMKKAKVQANLSWACSTASAHNLIVPCIGCSQCVCITGFGPLRLS